MVLSALALGSAAAAMAATTAPVVWTAGGVDAGSTGAGQSARMVRDASGNLAVVSGPANARDLAVTSYTFDGVLRWRRSVTPASSTYVGDWIAASPDGDVMAAGRNVDSRGSSFAIVLARWSSDGTLRWRTDIQRTRPSVARVLVDAAGNSYVAISSMNLVQNIEIFKHSPTGALLWTQQASTASGALDVAKSLALSPDGSELALAGNIGANWIVGSFSAATGARRWFFAAPEGVAANDVVVDSSRVYVTGQGAVGISYFLTVVAYDRATGAKLWRANSAPAGTQAVGHRIALAPDGSLAVAGSSSGGGYFDWWLVALEAASGGVRWQTARNAAVTLDEIPSNIFFLTDGTAVASGIGGPAVRDVLGNSYLQGVVAGYSPTGVALWEGFAKLGTVWSTALVNGDVCATGGYDALTTCWRLSGSVGPPLAPSNLTVVSVAGGPRLTWTDNSDNEISFAIERAAYDGNPGIWTPYEQIATVAANTTTFVDPMSISGNSRYRVRARNSAGASAYSNEVALFTFSSDIPPTAVATATPATGTAPLTVTLNGSGSSTINGSVIGWTWFFGDGTTGSGAVASHVYTAPGTYPAMLMVMNSSHMIDTTTVNVVVSAVPTAPSAPNNLAVAAVDRTSVTLTWTNTTSNQTEVQIERCRGLFCTNFAQVAKGAGSLTAFVEFGLSPRTTYKYRVRSANAVGPSPYSNTVTVTTLR